MAVVEAVANAAGTDPLALEPPLTRVVDTDALDSLFAAGSVTRVAFEYAGHEVVVEGDETITVDGEIAPGGR